MKKEQPLSILIVYLVDVISIVKKIITIKQKINSYGKKRI